MTDDQAAALRIAGRFLQSPDWPSGRVRIQPAHGESYPAAVLRTIGTLEPSQRQELRELVAWVLDYERATG